ncbi:TrmH family RNA methyltransferase [Aquimarina rhabdastrellae]
MVSKNQKKLIKSLAQKKYRKQHRLFVAEGIKVIQELIDAKLKLKSLYCSNGVEFKNVARDQQIIVEETALKQISFLTTPQKALAIFEIPIGEESLNDGLIVALDDIRDPGNLGTIIRLCDWFGVKELICSKTTVDCYNPKVIQATMGSISRVAIRYVDLPNYIAEQATSLPVFGTFMKGENLYKTTLPEKGIIIMGNEANGISNEIECLVNKRLTIPRFGPIQETESLNVAMATSILLSEFKRSFA